MVGEWNIKIEVLKIGAGKSVKRLVLDAKDSIQKSQRYIMIKEGKKQLPYPPFESKVGEFFEYIQTDKDTYLPLVLHTKDTLPSDILRVVDEHEKTNAKYADLNPLKEDGTLQNPQEALPDGVYISHLENIQAQDEEGKPITQQSVTIDKKLTDRIFEYVTAAKLMPFVDPSYKYVYAHNVEEILDATKAPKGLIEKLMPVLMVIATGIAILFVYYGAAQIYTHLPTALTVVCASPATPTTTSILPVTPVPRI